MTTNCKPTLSSRAPTRAPRPGAAAALRRPVHALAAAAAALGLLAGCAPLLPLMVGGAVVGGGLVATDRRTTGTQIEDQGIENRANARVRELDTKGHVKIQSYNRVVLITGEVPDERARDLVSQTVSQVENVRAVINELALGPNSGVRGRSSDALLATKVKATLVDARDLQSNAFSVVVTRGNVYLMGRVTEREATAAVELVRTIAGVERVVPAYELVTEDELAGIIRVTPQSGTGTAAPAAASPASPSAPSSPAVPVVPVVPVAPVAPASAPQSTVPTAPAPAPAPAAPMQR